MVIKVGQDRGDIVGNDDLALQRAVDAVAAHGGGTVEVGPGTYLLRNSVRMRSNVRLAGSGEDTVLRKSDGVCTPFVIDADYGQSKVTVEDPSGFHTGMGVLVLDGAAGDWAQTVATVTHVVGNVLYLDRLLIGDYCTEQNGAVFNSFSPLVFSEVHSARAEGLCIEGNRESNRRMNGCIGAGIYVVKSRACSIADCQVRNFSGDGLVTAITQDISVERCLLTGASDLGLHFGAGSARPLARGNTCTRNGSVGLFLCWRVQEGRFEDNLIADNLGVGLSLGHKDTDNLFIGNTVRRNASAGIIFRLEKPTNAGHRNRFERNLIEDNVGPGVRIRPATSDLVFAGNTLRDTRTGAARTQRVGISAEEGTARIRAVGNDFANHPDGEVEGDVELA